MLKHILLRQKVEGIDSMHTPLGVGEYFARDASCNPEHWGGSIMLLATFSTLFHKIPNRGTVWHRWLMAAVLHNNSILIINNYY